MKGLRQFTVKDITQVTDYCIVREVLFPDGSDQLYTSAAFIPGKPRSARLTRE